MQQRLRRLRLAVGKRGGHDGPRMDLAVTWNMVSGTVAWFENRHQRKRLRGGVLTANVCRCGGRKGGETTLELRGLK